MTFLKSMLQDGHDGSWSSKRVITLLAFVIVSVSYLADQFTQYKATQTLFDSVIYLVIAGLGFTASEKFAKKENKNE
jgi:hypothetical protein